jgi:hypothetical protein
MVAAYEALYEEPRDSWIHPGSMSVLPLSQRQRSIRPADLAKPVLSTR